jgi:hypothetical protein
METHLAAGAHGMRTSVTCRQVINLLSLTWPDGNYEAASPDRPPRAAGDPCGNHGCLHRRDHHDDRIVGNPCTVQLAKGGSCLCGRFREDTSG